MKSKNLKNKILDNNNEILLPLCFSTSNEEKSSEEGVEFRSSFSNYYNGQLKGPFLFYKPISRVFEYED